jgi:hypothetical protein
MWWGGGGGGGGKEGLAIAERGWWGVALNHKLKGQGYICNGRPACTGLTLREGKGGLGEGYMRVKVHNGG